MDFNYKKPRYGRQQNNFKFIIIVSVISLLLIALVLSLFFIINKNVSGIFDYKHLKNHYKKLFVDKNYTELIRKMDIELKKTPFNQKYLIFRGYSYFLLGEEEEDITKRNSFFSLAIIDLRRAMAVGIPGKNIGDVFFCIGKIYYYFGEPYYKQSLQYLKRAYDAGIDRIDLFYMLGLVYSHVGNYKDSVNVFLEALNREDSDLILLAIANSYFKDADYENSQKYLTRIIEVSSQPKVKEKSYFLMGEIFYNEKKYYESKKYFDKVIKINENNPSAYYFRGEIFYLLNDRVRARAEWRKALEIDPSHVKALKRLYYN